MRIALDRMRRIVDTTRRDRKGLVYNRCMVSQAHLDDSGGVRLPADLMRRIGWHAGDALTVEPHADGLLIRRADDAALGEAGRKLAGQTLPPEDFSAWEAKGA